jgi:hypothetical protein
VFSETEDMESYFDALQEHLTKYGRPRALYTDRFSIFQTTHKVGKTQIQRALKELDIELIFANSPQAKGRVKRAHRTLQDRLVKELKLRDIKTIKEANLFAKEFIEAYNQKFSKEPVSSVNAHRSWKDLTSSEFSAVSRVAPFCPIALFNLRTSYSKFKEF